MPQRPVGPFLALCAAVIALAWWIAPTVGPGPSPGAVQPPVPATSPPAPRPPAGSVRVAVRDPAGTPIAGARVLAVAPVRRATRTWPPSAAPTALDGWRELPPSWDLSPRAASAAGAVGVASLTDLDPGDVAVVVETPSRVRRSVACKVAAHESTEVAILSDEGHPLAGRVLTDTGAPVDGAIVLAEYPAFAPDGRCDDVPRDFALARSDAEGRFRFDALPATTVSIRCGTPQAWSSHAWNVLVPSVSSIDLRMTARGPVEGVVRGEPDGRPLAGADVLYSVTTWHTAKVTAHAVTDAQGRYRIPLYPGTGVLGITVEASGWWDMPRVVGARQPPFRLYEDRATVLDLSVRPDAPEFAVIRGVVRGPDGPVPDAEVWLTTDDEDHWMSLTRPSDAQGRFWFLDAPARRLAVAVNTTAGLYQPGQSRLFEEHGPLPDPNAPWWIAADAPRPVDIEVTMARGGRISGRVIDESDRPVTGAEVWSRDGVRSISRDDGTFEIVGLDEPSETSVWAKKREAGLEGKSECVTAGAGADAEGVVVRVAASAPTGAGARVVVTGRAHAADPAASLRGAHVECDGAWTPLVTGGAFRLEFQAKPYRKQADLEVVIPGWGERTARIDVSPLGGPADAGDIEVPRAGSVTGCVTDAAGPVGGALVRIEPRRVSSGIACGFDEDPAALIAAVTAADGTFQATPFAEGAYTVHIEAIGHIEETADVDVVSGDPAACAVRLFREAFLRGRVVHSDGRPAAGASVDATPEGESGLDAWRRRGSDTTGSDGAFEMRVRDGLLYGIEVRPAYDGKEKFLPASSGPHEPDGQPLTITLDEGRRISGRVVDADGHPVPQARIACVPHGESPDFSESVETGADGTFTVTALADGSYDVAMTIGLEDAVVTADVLAGREDVEFRLGPGSAIEGMLLDEEGRPAPGRGVIARRMSPDEDHADAKTAARTDASGRFRLVAVGSEPCRIDLDRDGRGVSYEGPWPLAGGAPVSPGSRGVVLRIPTPQDSSIAGRVVDDAGRPFLDFSLLLHTRTNVTVHHMGAAAGNEFEATGLRLDAPCRIDAEFSGLRWRLDIPVGTRDLALAAGPDGLHRVTMGGRTLGAARVEARFRDARGDSLHPHEARLLRVADGAVVPCTTLSDDAFTFTELPIGPYRVEARRDRDGDWLPCRPGEESGETVLVVGD